jgi:hypothetical protein
MERSTISAQLFDLLWRQIRWASLSTIENRRSFRGNGGFFICRKGKEKWIPAFAVMKTQIGHSKVFSRKGEKGMASKRVVSLILVLGLSAVAGAAATFDDLPLAAESFWNGSDCSGGFTSGGVRFSNNYNSDYDSWDAFTYSNITNKAASGWSAQYNAITGGGHEGSANYAIGYIGWVQPPTVTLSNSEVVEGFYATNNSYAYYSMRDGDMFAKKFGGTSGNDEDWFKLTITGEDAGGNQTGVVDFYLADFRFSNNDQDYIVNTWRFVDLTSLGQVKSLEFSLSSTDNGNYGMNTPGYFAIDTLIATPEPVTLTIMGIGALFIGVRGKRKD